MKHRLPIAAVFLILAVVGPRVQAALNIPLIIQEAIDPGSVAGLARTADPVTVGIPLPDDPATGATDVSQLTLTGTNVGQFRVLGRWPSGRIKWVLVDTLASLSARGTATGIAVTNGGRGNFGGSDLATDNGATITVATGPATFTIRKANFNGFHQVDVGATTVIAAGASTGLVISGPAPGNTTCGTCTTVYSSANDASSTGVIEENGPVRAVIKATGTHKDASGNPYMKFTVRIHLYKNRSHVKAVATLRNADHGASNSFATAYKGHQGYEWRLTPNMTGTLTYHLAKHGGAVETGTMSGSDGVYLYQGESQSLKSDDWCGFGCVPYTTDPGYAVVKNGGNLASGTNTQYPQGWADLRNASGVGLSIGVYQLAAYWPKSLEFNSGGSDVRIGIWPRQNSRPYYQAWPQWSTHDLYFNFHASALSSPANEFLKVQHYLLGRSAREHYNTSRVFPFPLVDRTVEDAFYRNTSNTANPRNSVVSNDRMCCPQDVGTVSPTWPLFIYRFKGWRAGGGGNQTEFRWSFLLNFLTRGFTGRYLDSAHFYRFQTDDVFPHSDGFHWRDNPSDTDPFGRPSLRSTSSANAHRSWMDQEHGHWYGMTDFYFMTGDEGVKDALLDGVGDWFLDDSAYQAGDYGGLFNTRAVGIQLMGAARFGTFLSAIGNTTDAGTVLTNSTTLFDLQVKGVLCTRAEAASQGCTPGPPYKNQGVSRTRGLHWGQDGTVQNWCGSPTGGWRAHSTWQSAILQQGILEFREAKGSGWSDYLTALDLAYGISKGSVQEGYLAAGKNRWDEDGFVAGLPIDNPANCASSPATADTSYFVAQPLQTMAMHFYTQYLVDGTTNWADKFKVNLLKDGAALGMATSDFGSYGPGALIAVLDKSTNVKLHTVPITGVLDNGGGSYTISWTVPTGAQSYRVKWGTRRIVDWIGFEPRKNAFIGDPNATMPWFAAANVPTLPAPAAAGTTQRLTISTGKSGLTAANFSVKAYVGGSGAGLPAPYHSSADTTPSEICPFTRNPVAIRFPGETLRLGSQQSGDLPDHRSHEACYE